MSLSTRIAPISGDQRKLVLEVDELPCAPQRADVGLEDAEVALREGPVDLLRHRAHDLHLDVARLGRHGGRWKLLAR